MDELCYLFKPKFVEIHQNNSIEWDAMERMVNLFVNFATHGNPQYVGWDQSKTDRAALWGCNIYANEFECDELPEAKRMGIWDDMFNRSSYIRSTRSSLLIGLFAIIMKNFFV